MHTVFVWIRRWANKRYIMWVCECMCARAHHCVRARERACVCKRRCVYVCAPGGTKTSTCSLNMNRLCVHRSLDLTPTGCPLVNSLVPVVFFWPYHFFSFLFFLLNMSFLGVYCFLGFKTKTFVLHIYSSL